MPLGTGVRFHDLRHICASLWFEAGIPLAVISRWLGHASVAVTNRAALAAPGARGVS